MLMSELHAKCQATSSRPTNTPQKRPVGQAYSAGIHTTVRREIDDWQITDDVMT